MTTNSPAAPHDGEEDAFSHGARRGRWVSALIFAALVLALVFPGAIAAETNCVSPPSGLVSWWPGDGSAVDVVGGNDGTLGAGVTYGPGEVGQEFVLPGDSGIAVGNSTNLQLQNFTIEVWIERGSVTQASAPPDGHGEAYFFGLGPGGYGFGIADYGALFLARVSQSAAYTTNIVITDTNFHHVAVTKNAGTVVFYVDGSPYAVPYYDPVFSFTTPASIGMPGTADISGQPPEGYAFWGSIDALSIYNRALASNEIQAIYTAGSAGKCLSAPFFFEQPTNLAIFGGNMATFTAVAHGSQPLYYQWVFNGTNISGETDATLSITNAQPAEGGTYSMIVSNSYGVLSSSNAVLTVDMIPDILSQPRSQTVPAFHPVTLSVVAVGPVPLQYQWVLDGTNIAWATNSSLVLNNVLPSDSGTYSVILGTEPNVTVSSNALLVIQIPPSFKSQPQSQAVIPGTNVIFSATFVGTALTYQWLENDLVLVGQTNSTLLLTNVSTNSTGNYSVVIRNSVGVATSTLAVLSVMTGPPSILEQPRSQSVWVGDILSLSVTAASDRTFGIPPQITSGTLQLWLKADTGVLAGSNGLVSQWQDQSGNGNNALQANVNQQPVLVYASTIGGMPAIRFSGVQNSSQSEFLHGAGTVFAPIEMTTFMLYEMDADADADQVPFMIGVPGYTDGCRANFAASGQMGFSFWGNDYYTGYTIPTNTYRIWTDLLSQESTYLDLKIFDDTLAETTNFNLNVPTDNSDFLGAGYYVGGLDPTAIASHIFGGDIAELMIYSGALSDPDRLAVINYLKRKYYLTDDVGLSFQWLFNGTNIAGATNAVLTLPIVQSTQAGPYSVVVSNVYGGVTSSNAVIEVNLLPVIVAQPTNQTVIAHQTAIFSVLADGPASLQYQWTFDGTNIAGAKNSILSFGDTLPSEAGSYAVILGTEPNVTVSSNAVLGLYPANEIVSNLDEGDLIADLQRGEIVTFATNGTIFLTNTITISNNVILDGTGHSITISGNVSGPLFGVSPGVSFTLRNLTVANATNNGSPFASGTPLPVNGAANGGAIFNQGNLFVTNCIFSNDIANGGPSFWPELSSGSPGQGGAIYNSGFLAISNSVFARNSAIGGTDNGANVGRATGGGSAAGGAIFNAGGTLLLSTVTFSGDAAIGAPPAPDAANTSPSTGGSAAGGAIFSSGGNISAWNITAIGNRAVGQGAQDTFGSPPEILYDGNAGGAYAGALYFGGGNVTISNSIISNNSATGGTSGNGAGGVGQGGGVLNLGTTLLSQCNIAGNTARGGGIDGSFEAFGNSAPGSGGGVYNAGSIQIIGALLSSNTAVGGAGTSIPAMGFGGAMYNSGVVQVFNTVLSNNLSTGTSNYGQAIYNTGAFTADSNSSVAYQSAQTPPLVYEWQLNGTNVAGATSSVINLTNIQFNDSGTYSLLVSNSTGLVANLDEILNQPLTNSPSFVLQPVNQTAIASTTVDFEAAAVSFPAPTYQWLFDGTNLSGATSSSLVLPNIQPNQSGTYSVIATNLYGSLTSQSATLNVEGILLTGIDLGTGGFSITSAGMLGTNFIIEVSTNLLDWQPLQTNTSPLNFTDPNTAANSARFYRLELAH